MMFFEPGKRTETPVGWKDDVGIYIEIRLIMVSFGPLCGPNVCKVQYG